VFRRGGDTSFIAAELKEIVDPKGGNWQDGVFVPSLVAKIGRIIEQHTRPTKSNDWNASDADFVDDANLALASASAASCPSCGEYALRNEGGCMTCSSCGHSKCG